MAPSTMALKAAVATAGLAVAMAQNATSSNMDSWYLGSAVQGRNVPPLEGCTVVGKLYRWGEGKYDPLQPYQHSIAWDWCQNLCSQTHFVNGQGMAVPCAHFAFYPDGSCYFSGNDTHLVDDDVCSMENTTRCPHDFKVISGPASCDNKADWADPNYVPPGGEAATTAPYPPLFQPTEPPKLAQAGEMCAENLPPGQAVTCSPGLVCTYESDLPGAAGNCILPTPAPPVMPNITVPEVSVPTVEPPPANGTITGWYYVPQTMEGTVKTTQADWKACQSLCASNPFCQHFGYWPDQGCHLQGSEVTLEKANCTAEDTSCPGLQVISGPRDFSNPALFPVLGPDGLPVVVTPTLPAPVVPGVGDKDVSVPTALPTMPPVDVNTSAQVEVPTVAPEVVEEKKEGGGHMTMIWVLAGIALAVGGLIVAYTQGAFDSVFGGGDSEGEEEDAENQDSYSGLGKPLAAAE